MLEPGPSHKEGTYTQCSYMLYTGITNDYMVMPMVGLLLVVYRYYEWLHGYAKCCYMLYTGITNNYMTMLSVGITMLYTGITNTYMVMPNEASCWIPVLRNYLIIYPIKWLESISCYFGSRSHNNKHYSSLNQIRIVIIFQIYLETSKKACSIFLGINPYTCTWYLF